MSVGTILNDYNKSPYSEMNLGSSRLGGKSGFRNVVDEKTAENNDEGNNDALAETAKAVGKVKPPYMPYAGKHVVQNSNEYFAMAQGGDSITYKGTTFMVDRRSNALTVGDVRNPNNCIRVGLSKGGSLVFNRDEVGGVMDALSMFSPKDQEAIVKAIQIDNMAQKAKNEVEDAKSGENIKSADEE